MIQFLGLGMMGLGGITSAFSAFQQGRAESANRDYNAQLLKNQAEQVAMDARENTRRERRNADEQLSAARARLAAQGGVVTEGAPLQVIGDIGAELELGIQDAYRNAQVERGRLLSQASQERAAGKQAKVAGLMSAIGTLASTGGSMYFAQQQASVWKSAHGPSLMTGTKSTY